MFQGGATPSGGTNRRPKRQQLKIFQLLWPVERKPGPSVASSTGFAPFSRKLPWPNRKFVASHSEYAYFGTSDSMPNKL
jgi:hypothetical protein